MTTPPGGPPSLAVKRQLLRKLLLEKASAVSDRTDGIPRRPDRNQPAPLSFNQERLWLIDQLQPDNTAYTIPVAFRLRGPIDVGALQSALTEIVRRHESLRTRFPSGVEGPRQVVDRSMSVTIPVVTLTEIAQADREAEARLLTQQFAQQPFDLTTGPLFRATLFAIGSDDHVFAFSFHHIISDGWSIQVLLRELVAHYRATESGRPVDLPELTVQYQDFAVWHRNWADGPALTPHLDYWMERLGGVLPTLDLPTDRPRPPLRTFRAGQRVAAISPATEQGLVKLCRSEQSTPFAALLGAFAALLHRLTDQDDVLIGTPFAGRGRPETEQLIGFFVNTVVLRSDLSGRPSFRSLIRQTRDRSREAHANQDVPFERVVAELKPPTDLTRTPLFQVFFNLLGFPTETFQLPGVAIEPFREIPTEAKFDLTLYVEELRPGYRCTLVYNADLFDDDRIAELLAQYQQLLDVMVANPDQSIDDHSLVTPSKRPLLPDPTLSLASEWTGSVADRLSSHARQAPGHLAIVGGDDCWTYQQLDQVTNQLAHRLQNSGVERGDVVAVMARRTPSLVVALLGILKAGAAFVVLDPAYPTSRLVQTRLAARPKLTIRIEGTPSLEAGADEPSGMIELPFERQAVAASLAGWPTTPPRVAIGPDDLAYLAFTSGTTGVPKGIRGTHRPLGHFFNWYQSTFALGPSDRFSVLSGLSHDPLLRDVFAPLWVGGTVCVPAFDLITDADKLTGWIASTDVTVLHLTPGMIDLLVESSARTDRGVEGVRLACFGGERLTRAHLDRFRSLAPNARCVNVYGATETPQVMAWNDADAASGSTSIPIGTGIADVQVLILNRHAQLAGIGEIGEVHIRTPYLSDGYHDDEALTAEKFVPNPFTAQPADRMYRTGDLGRYRLDGAVDCLGRRDRQVNLRGFRIELGDIEAALSSLPGVRDSVVVLREPRPGQQQLVGYVAMSSPTKPTWQEIRPHLEHRLPSHLVPSTVITLDALPRTANGKIDLAALPAPSSSTRPVRRTTIGPRDPIETALREIWEDVLGVEVDDVATPFFDLGGDSLTAVRLFQRIDARFGRRLGLASLFDAPTIEALAKLLGEQGPATTSHREADLIEVSERMAPAPLSFAQRQLWLLDRLSPGGSAYNIPLSVRVQRPLDPEILSRALTEVVRRHDVLRTRIQLQNDEPVQVPAASEIVSLPVVDLSGLSPVDRDVEARRLVAKEAREPFDLSKGPLLRARLLKLATNDHVFLLTVHHIVADGWSVQLLAREVTALSDAFGSGRPSPLPPLPIQYGDFARWQKQFVQGEALESHLQYWRAQLAGPLPVLDLPTDRPRPPVRTSRGGHAVAEVDTELHAEVARFCREEGVTAFMTLFATFALFLRRLSGQDDIVVGSPFAGRSRPETESLIGFFVNTVVLRTDLTGNPTFREVVRRVRRTALEAHEHQDVPFERLLEELKPEADLSRTPLFQAFFNLLDFSKQLFNLPEVNSEGTEAFDQGTREAKFDVTLYVSDDKSRFRLTLVYNADLFDDERAREMLAQLQLLLAEVLADPDREISRYSLVTPSGRAVVPDPTRPLRSTWSGTIGKHVAVAAARQPNQIAVDAPGYEWTYDQLNAASNRLAHELRARGIGNGDIVAIIAARDPSLLLSILGVMKAGGAFTIIDPGYPPASLAERIRIAAPKVALRLEAAGTLPEDLEAALSTATTIAIPAGADLVTTLLASRSNAEPPGVSGPDDLAYVAFTSGTTGAAKAICGTHRPLAHFFEWYRTTFDLKPADRISVLSGLSHDPLLRDLFAALWVGGTVCFPDQKVLNQAGLLADWLRERRVSVAHLTPALGDLIAGALNPEEEPQPTSLRLACFGGDRLTRAHIRRFRRLAPSARCVNFYGATETPQAMSMATIPSESPGATDGLEVIPLGYGIANVQLLVVTPAGQLAGIGELGEVLIRTPYLSAGYLGDPELTRTRFVTNPFSGVATDRAYRTGDLGRYRPNGEVEFVGRADRQVKLRGFRIELGEVEAALATFPGARQAIAVLREDIVGEPRLVGYVAGDWPDAPGYEMIRAHLKGRLAGPLIPSAVLALPDLPRTPNGKIDQAALPVPAGTSKLAFWSSDGAPTNAIELRLCRIWEEALGLPVVRVHDDFFEIGGHSLTAVRVFGQVEVHFGIRLSLATLIHAPTVAKLAAVLRDDGCHAAESSLVPIETRGGKPPFFCVHGIGGNVLNYFELARELGPDQPFYGLQAVGLDGKALPLQRVEDMARHYLSEIRKIQPHGPYRIGGGCMGGVVAYAMATRLQEEGETVALLAFLDVPAPILLTALDRLDRRLYQSRTFGPALRMLARVMTWWRLPPRERLGKLRRIFDRRSSGQQGTERIVERRREVTSTAVHTANYWAMRSYKPNPLRGRIAHFFSDRRRNRSKHDRRLQWQNRATEGQEVFQISGDDSGLMLTRPHVELLARRLREVLDRTVDSSDL